MLKNPSLEQPRKARGEDLRKSPRAPLARPMRVRPSEPRDEHFEDKPISANASREGVYFTTGRTEYCKGMRLFVTYPAPSANDPISCEYLAEVVRVEKLAEQRFGVAVKLLMTMNYGGESESKSKLTGF
jgi:hypothetical protein